MTRIRPLGLLGGTFNPVHYGHLRIAEELAEALDLDEVRLIPAALPPLRDRPSVSAEQRYRMVEQAIAGNPRLVADPREVHKTVPCYTVDTLAGLRAEEGPERPLLLLLGADAFARLPRWHRWTELFDYAHIAVAERGGHPSIATMPLDRALERAIAARRTADPVRLAAEPAGCVYLVPTTVLQISATRIRSLIRTGRSARYLLPDPVLDYIRTHRLYREADAPTRH